MMRTVEEAKERERENIGKEERMKKVVKKN